MAESATGSIIEERREIVVSPPNGNPILRVAHFLKTPVDSSVPINDPPLKPTPFSRSSEAKISRLQKLSTLSPFRFNGWREPPGQWKSWVDHLRPTHQSTWKKAATITLEDMMMLGGLSVLGDFILSPLKGRELLEIEQKLIQARVETGRSKSRKATQSQWLNKFMKSKSDTEHEAFLSFWLSRFLFPANLTPIINKRVFHVAVRLANGTKVALAPAVLAILYRDLSLLKGKIMGLMETFDSEVGGNVSSIDLWAPFYLVQLWVWERFPTLKPKPRIVLNLKKAFSVLECEDEDRFQWRPYTKRMEDSSSPQFHKEDEDWVTISCDTASDLQSFARCLCVSRLVSMDCIEQYFPHRVARQFGFVQDVPGNVSALKVSPEAAWSNYSMPLKGMRLYVPSRLFRPYVTTRYLEWWRQSDFGQKSSERRDDRRPARPLNIKNEDDNEAFGARPGFAPKSKRARGDGFDDDDHEGFKLKHLNSEKVGDAVIEIASSSNSEDTSSDADNECTKEPNLPVASSSELEAAVEDGMESESKRKACHGQRKMSNEADGRGYDGLIFAGLELKARISDLEKIAALLKEGRLRK
ncbi:hypothetical protein Ancab_040181 [Ancistrocladus abbreviatus]